MLSKRTSSVGDLRVGRTLGSSEAEDCPRCWTRATSKLSVGSKLHQPWSAKWGEEAETVRGDIWRYHCTCEEFSIRFSLPLPSFNEVAVLGPTSWSR